MVWYILFATLNFGLSHSGSGPFTSHKPYFLFSIYMFVGITEPVDYSRYPSKDVQHKWLRFYLEETARIKGGLNDLHITTRKLMYRELRAPYKH